MLYCKYIYRGRIANTHSPQFIYANSCQIISNKIKGNKISSATPEYSTDLVCEMKVDKLHAYTYKHKGVEYYFDSKDCKEAFKMNPEKFIKN